MIFSLAGVLLLLTLLSPTKVVLSEFSQKTFLRSRDAAVFHGSYHDGRALDLVPQGGSENSNLNGTERHWWPSEGQEHEEGSGTKWWSWGKNFLFPDEDNGSNQTEDAQDGVNINEEVTGIWNWVLDLVGLDESEDTSWSSPTPHGSENGTQDMGGNETQHAGANETQDADESDEGKKDEGYSLWESMWESMWNTVGLGNPPYDTEGSGDNNENDNAGWSWGSWGNFP